MIARRLPALLLLAALALIAVWMTRHLYWQEVWTAVPPRGEAATDPYYAAKQLAAMLGARARSQHDLVGLPAAATSAIVLDGWSLRAFPARAARLKRWVASGGRLVIDLKTLDDTARLERWTGIRRLPPDASPYGPASTQTALAIELDGAGAVRSSRSYAVDGLGAGSSYLDTRERPAWRLLDVEEHVQGVRVRLGHGSVTAINGLPLHTWAFLQADNGLLFTDAVQLRRGDTIYFLSDAPGPTLLTWLARVPGPLLALAAMLLALWLWRSWPRFGPLEPATVTARRSLGEQIRGTGQFTLRYGKGRALHAASLRALGEAAARRIQRYGDLTPEARTQALARLTGYGAPQLARALADSGPRSRRDLYHTLALLECARRALLRTPDPQPPAHAPPAHEPPHAL